ncbi:MAG: anaerobic ribonucleoside-triphosphate reductase activating protein, partial [Clostridia bacterium]|nr:anaerobic ribonucleoside-triphosphate reductase activating protein [Clostridia bacterium]
KKIERSIQLLMTRAPDYEFRTTVVREFHDEASLIAAAEMIRGAKRYFLQSYRDSGDILAGSFNAYSPEEMTLMLDSVKSIIPSAELRGI